MVAMGKCLLSEGSPDTTSEECPVSRDRGRSPAAWDTRQHALPLYRCLVNDIFTYRAAPRIIIGNVLKIISDDHSGRLKPVTITIAGPTHSCMQLLGLPRYFTMSRELLL